MVGAVFRPKDLGKGYRKILENALRDLSPDTKDNVINLFDSWQGTSSKEKLIDILGRDEAERLLRRIKSHKEVDMVPD